MLMYSFPEHANAIGMRLIKPHATADITASSLTFCNPLRSRAGANPELVQSAQLQQ